MAVKTFCDRCEREAEVMEVDYWFDEAKMVDALCPKQENFSVGDLCKECRAKFTGMIKAWMKAKK